MKDLKDIKFFFEEQYFLFRVHLIIAVALAKIALKKWVHQKKWIAVLNQKECTSVHNQCTLTSYQLSSELFSNVIVLLCIAKIYRRQSLIGTLPRNDLTSIIKKVTKQVNLTFCRCLRPVSAWNWSEQIK